MSVLNSANPCTYLLTWIAPNILQISVIIPFVTSVLEDLTLFGLNCSLATAVKEPTKLLLWRC